MSVAGKLYEFVGGVRQRLVGLILRAEATRE